jgi:hypothetical protein
VAAPADSQQQAYGNIRIAAQAEGQHDMWKLDIQSAAMCFANYQRTEMHRQTQITPLGKSQAHTCIKWQIR